MARSKENVLLKLKEQTEFLLASVRGFYAGQFAESVRIATAIRALVHETKTSKPLLSQARSNGLELQISEHIANAPSGDEVFSFIVGARVGRGPEIAPSVDLASSHRTMSTVGVWWNRTVFVFPFNGNRVVCSRKKIILMLANKEGGAHVHPEEDEDYRRLLTNESLTFRYGDVPLRTPDLARFLAAQSGVEMLDCLQRNFFPDLELPSKWEFGPAPPVSLSVDHISASVVTRSFTLFHEPKWRLWRGVLARKASPDPKGPPTRGEYKARAARQRVRLGVTPWQRENPCGGST